MSEETKHLVLAMHIDLGEGRSEVLRLYDTDVIEKVLEGFAQKVSLAPKWARVLSQQVYKAINLMIKEQEERESEYHWKLWNSIKNSPKEILLKKDKKTMSKGPSDGGERLYSQEIVKKQSLAREATKKPINGNSTERQQSYSESRLRQHVDEALKEFSFKPKINEKSKALLKSKKRDFIELYNDAKARVERHKEKDAEYYEQFTHRPQINQYEKQSTEKVGDRLFNDRLRLEVKRQFKQKEFMNSIDPVTGQELYKPKISPFKSSNPPRSRPAPEPEPLPSFSPKIHSDWLYSQLKAKKFIELFELLKPDQQGVLQKCYTDDLHPSIVKIITPILEEITELQTGITAEEFCEALDRLFKELTPEGKQLLLKVPKKTVTEAKPAQGKRTVRSNSQTIFARNLAKLAETKAKLEKEREHVMVEELKQCTFKPTTNISKL